MFCMNCGQQLPSDASFCPDCGQKVESSSDMPGTNVSAQNGQIEANAPVEIESYMNYAIIITVLATFNCGFPFNLVLGIAAIVYADKVERNLRSGNVNEAKECAKTAKMLCMIAIAVIGVQILLAVLVFLFILLVQFAILCR